MTGSNTLGSLLGPQNPASLSRKSISLLSVPNTAAAMQQAIGMPMDDHPSTTGTLVNILIDDSGSMGRMVDAVIEGFRALIADLKAMKEADSVLVSVTLLNAGLLCPFVPLDQVPELTRLNYRADGGTELNDRSIEVLGATLKKYTDDMLAAGIRGQTFTLLVSDGHDEGSSRTAADVAALVRDMRKSEAHQHTISAMGISDGGITDFHKVFQSMGVAPELILTPDKTRQGLHDGWRMVSRSAVLVSKGMSPVGGFGGNP